MIKILAVAALAVAVSACSTTTPAERRAQYEGACTGYGFKAGTDAYATCMMQMDRDAQVDDQNRREAAAASLRQIGQNMQQTRSVTCNTFGNRSGAFNNSTTTCY